MSDKTFKFLSGQGPSSTNYWSTPWFKTFFCLARNRKDWAFSGLTVIRNYIGVLTQLWATWSHFNLFLVWYFVSPWLTLFVMLFLLIFLLYSIQPLPIIQIDINPNYNLPVFRRCKNLALLDSKLRSESRLALGKCWLCSWRVKRRFMKRLSS